MKEDERATLIDDGGQPLVTEIEGEQKPITVLKVKGDNGQVYTDPLAWKLGKQGRWERSAWKDHWRSIQHTDTRHPDDSKYRTLSLGTVKELRNATANLLSERGGGGGSGDSGGGGDGGSEGGQAVSRGRGAAEEPVVEAESDLQEAAAEKIAEFAEKIAGKAQAQQQYHQKEKAANTKKRSRSVDDLKTNNLKTVCWDCKRDKFSQKHFSRSQCRQVAGHTACDWKEDPRELHRKRDQGDESDDDGVRSSSQQRGQKRRWQDDEEDDDDDDEMDEEEEPEHEKEIKQQFTQHVNDNGHKCYLKRCDKDFSKVPDQQRNAQITKHMMKCHRHLLEPKGKGV